MNKTVFILIITFLCVCLLCFCACAESEEMGTAEIDAHRNVAFKTAMPF